LNTKPSIPLVPEPELKMKKETGPLLVLDIGNTNTVFGLYGEQWVHGPWRIKSDSSRTEDEYATLLGYLMQRVGVSTSDLSGVAIASVVPPLTRILRHWCEKYTENRPVIVGYRSKLNIGIDFSDPSRIGADRLANAAAAFASFGAPVITIDFGTATTFDIVNEEGNYCGGVICPGPLLAADELASRTAKLPQVSLRRPSSVVGSDTEESIRSGLHYGTIGQLNGILASIIADRGWKEPAVVATGGLSAYFSDHIPLVRESNPMLTLEGVRLIYELNKI